MATDIWPAVHAERAALAADLAGIDDAGWDTRSLCDDWTVRDVVAHMTATANISQGSFLPKLIGSGFSLGRLQAKDIVTFKGASPAQTLENFTAVQSSRKHPPGPMQSWLGETLIHAEDIRRPLGIKHDYAAEAAKQVADFYKGSNLIIGAKKRVAGVKLRATDIDWVHGDGAEAAGPIMSLVLAMTGRKAALDEIEGAGVEVLRSRP